MPTPTDKRNPCLTWLESSFLSKAIEWAFESPVSKFPLETFRIVGVPQMEKEAYRRNFTRLR